jgi:hypothetical protein
MSSRALTKPRRVEPTAPSIPGAEFLGRARDARRIVTTWGQRDGAEMIRIATDAQNAYRGRTTNIPERLVQSIADRWRKISRDGCLSQSLLLDGRNLSISDVRLVGATGQQLDPRYMPGEKEPAFCAVSNQLTLGKRRMSTAGPIVFGVALNAVAFWYQFGFSNAWDDLLADMAMLAKCAAAVCDPAGPLQFSLPANGGAWCGLRAIDPATENRYADIRSFVGDDLRRRLSMPG